MKKKKRRNSSVSYFWQVVSSFVMVYMMFLVIGEKANNQKYFEERAKLTAQEQIAEPLPNFKKIYESQEFESEYKYSDFIALSKNIFYEARSASYHEKVRVANVTVNRMKSRRYPDSAKEVVTQYKQFSWTLDETNNIDRVKRLVMSNDEERRAWAECKEIAHLALTGQLQDLSNGAMFYHTHAVSPKWAKKMQIATKSKWHIYYKG